MFQFPKRILYQMPEAIEIRVIVSRFFAPLARRDYRIDPSFRKAIRKPITVVSFVGQQIFSIYTLDKLASLRAICNGTCCNKHSGRHIMRIHGQVYLGVEPPLVQAIS